MTDTNLQVGQMVISYEINPDGQMETGFSFPDFDELGIDRQLGLLRLAEDTLLRMDEVDHD